MRHARPPALAQLSGLLAEIRQLPSLVERQLGIFYRRSQSFLHFHEDPAGLFADLRLTPGDEFSRFQVDTSEQQARLLAAVAAVSAPTRPGP